MEMAILVKGPYALAPSRPYFEREWLERSEKGVLD